MTPLLRVADLRTYYGAPPDVVRAVDGVSFTVGHGERRGIVGESGSGKTTLALSLLRLIGPPDGSIVTGAVELDGHDLLQLTEEEMRTVRGNRIAMVFQDPATSLNPVFTVGAQLVETIRAHHRVSRTGARRLAVEALAAVRLPDPDRRMDDYPHRLSGGMKQRVMIALAMAGDPRLLVADEPTSALDVTTRAQILELMFTLAEERAAAVLLVAHDLDAVASFCDTVQVMYAGRIVEQGPAGAVYAHPRHPYTRRLLAARPRIDGPRRRLQPVPGPPISPSALPTGCRFRTRCDHAVDLCAEATPPLSPHGMAMHPVACHRAEELPAPTLGWEPVRAPSP